MVKRKPKKDSAPPYLPELGKAELDYIQQRILSQIQYYSWSSKKLRREYYTLSIINIAIMAAVPVVSMLPDSVTSAKYVVAVISALASIFSSVLLIRQTKDNWLEYRATSEMLKSELALFKVGGCGYRMEDMGQRFALLVERCEGIMGTERSGWYSRMKREADQTYGVSGASEETGS